MGFHEPAITDGYRVYAVILYADSTRAKLDPIEEGKSCVCPVNHPQKSIMSTADIMDIHFMVE